MSAAALMTEAFGKGDIVLKSCEHPRLEFDLNTHLSISVSGDADFECVEMLSRRWLIAKSMELRRHRLATRLSLGD